MTNDTLPSWLSFQAKAQPLRVALRHKKLGIWHTQQWRQLQQALLRSVGLLQQKGFQQGDTLFLLSHPRPEALLLAIAAHWLGGVSAPLDPDYEVSGIVDLLHALKPAFVFAEAQQQVDQVLQASDDIRLLIYADARGLSHYQHPALCAYAAIDFLEAIDSVSPLPLALPEDVAFKFYRLSEADPSDASSPFSEFAKLEFNTLTHAEMLANARQLIQKEALTANEEALAARAFAASGHVRYLLSPWLLAGFILNFPENIDTRDFDRRELGPTLVAGTSATYQRLESVIASRLPLANTWHRRLLDWSLATTNSHPLYRRLIADWLIVRPLRDVIGFSRARVPLLVGEPLPQKSLHFFAALGIHVRTWPDEAHWNATDIPVVRIKPKQRQRLAHVGVAA